MEKFKVDLSKNCDRLKVAGIAVGAYFTYSILKYSYWHYKASQLRAKGRKLVAERDARIFDHYFDRVVPCEQ